MDFFIPTFLLMVTVKAFMTSCVVLCTCISHVVIHLLLIGCRILVGDTHLFFYYFVMVLFT